MVLNYELCWRNAMKKSRIKIALIFVLGVLSFPLGSFLFNIIFQSTSPEKGGIVEDWDRICLWQDTDGIYLAISPKGCYSPTCTLTKLQTGTATVDLQNQDIHLTARFVLQKTSRFPLPCADSCSGGGQVQFVLDQLIPQDYTLWFREQEVGTVNIFSGREIPRQCFENPL
jgi:hypothetical protein